MKFFSNLKTTTKLIISLVIGLLFIFIIGFSGINNMKNINNNLSDVYENRFIPSTLLEKIQKILLHLNVKY